MQTLGTNERMKQSSQVDPRGIRERLTELLDASERYEGTPHRALRLIKGFLLSAFDLVRGV